MELTSKHKSTTATATNHSRNNPTMNDFLPIDNPTIAPCETVAIRNLHNPLPLLDWSEACLSSARVDWDQEVNGAATRIKPTTSTETTTELNCETSTVDVAGLQTAPIDTPSSSHNLSNDKLNDPVARFVQARLDIFQSNMRFLSIGLRYCINELADAHFSGIEKFVSLPHSCESGILVAKKFFASFP